MGIGITTQSNVFVGIKPELGQGAYGAYTAGIGEEEDKGSAQSPLEQCDYLLVPLTNARYRDSMKAQFEAYRESGASELRLEAPQLQELGVLPSSGGNGGSRSNSNGSTSGGNGGIGAATPQYIGLVSSFLELDSSEVDVRELSLQVLQHELEYANFVGIRQVIVAPPKRLNTLHYYAQSLARVFDQFGERCPTVSISLPLFEDSDPLSTWELWNTIRKMCRYAGKLSVSLALPRQRTPGYVLERWLSEPVTCLLISASVFTTNQYNYPVLNRFNQHLITAFQRVNGSASQFGELAILLHGMEKYVDKLCVGPSQYLEYINYLLKKGDNLIAMENSDANLDSNSKSNPIANGNGNGNGNGNANASHAFFSMEPRVMPPLLPHCEDLSNAVYQTFERDAVKYEQYERAIAMAVSDILMENSSRWRGSNEIVILVAGAGRGPLVDKTFKVLDTLRVTNFRLLAIEKNPHALLYLQKRNFEHWDNRVEITMCDIREWDDHVKVDLCISELLGSFGCNELSPECLAPIEQFHSKPSTRFIPQSYSSYAAPVSSPILYQSLSQRGRQYLEQPSVIHHIPYCQTSSRINEIWNFTHSHEERLSQFNKTSVSHFRVKHKSEIHGIVGYFIATLYADITLSTVPDGSILKTLQDQENSTIENSRNHNGSSSTPTKGNHTENMRSWSPIFFPLKEPLFLNDDTEVELFMSRNNNKDKVWYEWSASCFVYLVSSSDVHNNSVEREKHNHTLKDNGTDLETQKLTNAFARFGHQHDSSNGESKFFEDSVNHTDFMSNRGNEWESVKDLHELQNRQIPSILDKERVERKKSFVEEYHVRVRTSVSQLHNPNGSTYAIPL